MNKTTLKAENLSFEEDIYSGGVIQKIALRYQEDAGAKQLFDNSIDVVMRIFMQQLLKNTNPKESIILWQFYIKCIKIIFLKNS